MADRSRMRSGRWITALGFAGLGIGAVLFTLGVNLGLSAVLLALGALSLTLGVFRRPALTTKEELSDGADAEAARLRSLPWDGGGGGGG